MIDLTTIPNKITGDQLTAAEFDLVVAAIKELQLAEFPAIGPTANAGAGQSINLPTVAGTVSGSATAGSAAIASYLWSRVSGPTVSLDTPNALTLQYSAVSGQGALVLNLRVTDINGLHGDSQVTLTFVYVNPHVVAGSNPAIQLPANSGTLQATVTQGSYALATVNPKTFTAPAGCTVDANGNYTTPSAVGNYVFTVTGKDINNQTTTINIPIAVSAASLRLYYDFFASDPSLGDVTVLNLTQSVVVSSGAQWAAYAGNGDGKWFAGRIVNTEADKTTWFNTNLNSGSIPDTQFKAFQTVGNNKYLFSRDVVTIDSQNPVLIFN